MKKYILTLLCTAVQVVAVMAQGTYMETAKQAEDLSKQGKYEASLETYTKAIDKNNRDFKLWVNRGICLMNLKRYEDALKDFNQALQLKPNDPTALQGRAGCKATLRDYKGALADYTTLLTQQPKETLNLFERGKVKIQSEDYPGALTDLKECLNRSYKPAETNYWMGVANYAQKNFKRAVELFHLAGTLDKTMLDAYYEEALATAALGKYVKAVSIVDPILEKNPKDARMYILRATLNVDARRYTQAKLDIGKVGELQPNSTDVVLLNIKVKNGLSDYKGALSAIDSMLQKHPSGNDLLYMERGRALFHLGKQEEAESSFEQSLALNPEFVESYYERGLMYIDRKDYRKAIFDFNKAIEINDQLAYGWFLKGRALIGLEQVDEAMVAINQGLELGGGPDEVGYHLLGLAYATNKDESNAMKAYEKSLSINPTYASVRVDRANLYLQQGKAQDALLDIQTALKDEPHSVTALCVQGKVLAFQKQFEQAVQAYSKAIDVDAEWSEAYFGRGMVYSKLGKQKEAIQDLSKAIKLDDNYADAYYERGLLNKKLGDTDAARKDFDAAYSLGNEQAKKEGEAIKK